MDNQIKIRASMVGLIMTSPKLKADKKAGLLSETAKTFVESIWLENMFEYRKEVITDEIYKGLIVEQDAMGLVQSVLGGEFRKKYRHNLENDYLTGHPDIVLSDCVEDVKSSYDVRTFFNSELTPLYEYQLRSYLALTGLKKAKLIYCLVPTPDKIILNEKKKLYYQFDCDEENPDYIRLSRQIEVNHTAAMSVMTPKQRIRIFEITHDEEILQKMYAQVIKARIYYQSLKF